MEPNRDTLESLVGRGRELAHQLGHRMGPQRDEYTGAYVAICEQCSAPFVVMLRDQALEIRGTACATLCEVPRELAVPSEQAVRRGTGNLAARLAIVEARQHYAESEERRIALNAAIQRSRAIVARGERALQALQDRGDPREIAAFEERLGKWHGYLARLLEIWNSRLVAPAQGRAGVPAGERGPSAW